MVLTLYQLQIQPKQLRHSFQIQIKLYCTKTPMSPTPQPPSLLRRYLNPTPTSLLSSSVILSPQLMMSMSTHSHLTLEDPCRYLQLSKWYLLSFWFIFQYILCCYYYNLTTRSSAPMKPIQLVSFDQNKQVVVNEQAVSWLMKANQDKHLAIVTVVGKYRTGKSYILNRVLLNQNNGFQVGPTINACTKGLWVWPELIPHPTDPTVQYMVMDTEGLGSLEQGEEVDTKIFLMAMLLSSYFIYNSVGSIDQKAIQSLSLVVNLSKMLQKGNEKEMKNIINCFPSFMWLVRDFALRLQDNYGKAISPLQYLQNALKLQQGSSEMMVRKNTVRKELTTFFKDRDCFLLVRPVDDQAKLQNMSKVSDSELRPKFLQLINQLRSKVLCNIKKKMFKGKPCSPGMFVELCQYFCKSINQGGLPQIENNWDMVCRAQSSRVQKRCIQDFRRFLKTYDSRSSVEVDMKTFEGEANEIVVKLLKSFEKNALGDKLQKKKQIKELMVSEYERLKKKIATSKNQALDELLNNVNDQMYSLINQNSINSIFQISQRYDDIIETKSKGASDQTLYYLYKKSYEGIKTNCFTLFGNMLQSQKYQVEALEQKGKSSQNSLGRVQADSSKKLQQMQIRERQLRQNMVQQQIKAKQATEQLHRAREELSRLSQMTKNKENICITN